MSGINAPERSELYVLEDGERPVEIQEDTKIPNAATIKIVKQDHTLGNMLRFQLLSMSTVRFCGYKVPHPLHPYFLIKIQTDGSVTPTQVVEQACNALISQVSLLTTKFNREFSFKDAEGATGDQATAQEDPYGSGGGAWLGGRDYMDF